MYAEVTVRVCVILGEQEWVQQVHTDVAAEAQLLQRNSGQRRHPCDKLHRTERHDYNRPRAAGQHELRV